MPDAANPGAVMDATNDAQGLEAVNCRTHEMPLEDRLRYEAAHLVARASMWAPDVPGRIRDERTAEEMLDAARELARLREALLVAVRWIESDMPRIGWNLDRLRAIADTAAPAAQQEGE